MASVIAPLPKGYSSLLASTHLSKASNQKHFHIHHGSSSSQREALLFDLDLKEQPRPAHHSRTSNDASNRTAKPQHLPNESNGDMTSNHCKKARQSGSFSPAGVYSGSSNMHTRETGSRSRLSSAPIDCKKRPPSSQKYTVPNVFSQYGPEEILDALVEQTASSSWQ